MFKELGEFITRKPWIIIAIWVLVLVVMAPLAMNLSDRLKYDATNFMPHDTDSAKAQDLYTAQFPQASQSSQAQIITVIQSDNSSATHDFLNRLDSAVTKDASLKNESSTVSVYSAQQMALAGMTPMLYKNMHQAYDGMLAAMQGNATNDTQAGTSGQATAAGDDTLKATVVSMVMKNMGMEGADSSYFNYLMSLGPNMTDEQLQTAAAQWASTHDYNNPQVLPADVTGGMAKGNVTLYIVTLSADPNKDSNLVSDDVKELHSQISQIKSNGDYSGLNTYVTGSAAMDSDTQNAAQGDSSTMFTVLVVIVLLLLYFRSIVSPFVPLAGIVIAIVATMGALTIASYFVDLFYIVQMFLIVMMMGAGVDYCVFMLSRYAEERRNGNDVKGSVIAMVQHAGKSIASSGMTAALGFAAMALSGQAMFISMAIGVSIGLIIAMLVGLTLIPAVLTLIGDRMFWPNKIYDTKPRFTLTGMWEGITRFSLKHAKVIVVLAILVAIPSIYVAMQMSTGMDTVSMLPSGAESKVGYTILADTMGTGSMSRAMITVTLPENITDASGNLTPAAIAQIQTITADVAKIKGIDKVYSITSPEGTPINFQDLSSYSAADLASFAQNLNSSVGSDGRTMLVYASFTGSPSSNDAYKSIDDMRSALGNYANSAAGAGITYHVGGESAMMHDVQNSMMNGFYKVIPVVVIGILIILFALLRSVFLPLRMILTLAISIMITVAAFTLVFQYWQNQVIMFMLPMMLFCSLMGTGVDYDIFLVSRIREERLKGVSDKEAILRGVKSTGTIIGICAFIMGGAFATLMLSKMSMMQQMGFALFFGIMFNALIMLLFVVPAIMNIKGKWNWWFPGQKHMPDGKEVKTAEVEVKH